MKFPFTNWHLNFTKENRSASKEEISHVSAWSPDLYYRRDRPMLLSTVYRCVDLISDSVAMLPFETYKIDNEGFKVQYKSHPAYNVLNFEPNSDMTRFTFFKTMIASMLLTGNAYAYIERDDKLRVVELIYIPTSHVGIEWIIDSQGISRKRYRVSDFRDLVEPKDMIHLLNFSYDGIIGISTLAHAKNTLMLSNDSENHAMGFFRGGANSAGILTIEGTRLTNEQKQQNYDAWEARTNSATGRPNGIVILEGTMHYQPITISPKDSQLLESRQFNVIDICRFFSVSPVKAFDLSKSSYSTIEATQLAFLTDTLSPLLAKIELEINRKVFLPNEQSTCKAEFNTTLLLRADKVAQATYWKELFNVGAATPNEVRRENNLAKMEGGDHAFVQVNVQTLDSAVKMYYKNSVVDKEDNNTDQNG